MSSPANAGCPAIEVMKIDSKEAAYLEFLRMMIMVNARNCEGFSQGERG